MVQRHSKSHGKVFSFFSTHFLIIIISSNIFSFNLTSVYDSSTNTLKIPENLKQFFYEYNHSQFIECNFELAKHNFQQSNGTHYQHKKLYQERAPCLIHIKKKLESMYKSYWLTSGSLLGKINSFTLLNFIEFYFYN